jgi:hypothetical protein
LYPAWLAHRKFGQFSSEIRCLTLLTRPTLDGYVFGFLRWHQIGSSIVGVAPDERGGHPNVAKIFSRLAERPNFAGLRITPLPAGQVLRFGLPSQFGRTWPPMIPDLVQTAGKGAALLVPLK